MKSLILLLSILGASAQASQVCGNLIPCGTYQREEEVAGKKILHEMKFTGISAREVKWEIVKTEDGRRTVDEAIMVFHPNGTFTVTKAEGVTVTGICLDNGCSAAIRPYLHDGIQDEQAVLLRFATDSLQMSKLTVDANGKTYPTNATYDKAP